MPDRFRFQGQVYRAHNPRWAWAPESGEGARRYGGRFNPAGTAALYTSMDFKTAWLEAQQGFPFKPQPLTLCAYDVDCEDIVDLTQRAVLEELGLNHDDLAGPWEDQVDRGRTPPSHSVARRLIDEGVAGIIVPCFAPGADAAARNLVFWNWRRRRPHLVRVVDDEGRLRDQSGHSTSSTRRSHSRGARAGSVTSFKRCASSPARAGLSCPRVKTVQAHGR